MLDLSIDNTQRLISLECDRLRAMLLGKNRKYGNAAIDPICIFSKADPLAQIDVRIDDKLSRIRSGQADEDVELDLIGYLVLKRVAKRLHSTKGLSDGLQADLADAKRDPVLD